MFLFCVGSLLQCFRLRIRAQIFRPDLGSVRSPPLLHLVAHLLINTNLLTSYASMYIRKNILNSSLSWSKSSQIHQWYRLLCFSASYGFTQHFLFLVFETLLSFLLYFINYEAVATTQLAPIFFFLSVSLLLPIFFTSHCLPLPYSDFFSISAFKFVSRRSFLQKRKEKKKIFIENHKKYGKSH